MTCTAVILSASTSTQNFLGASLPERSRFGSSFLALGRGSGRKAF